jgi:hypothetical protein
LSNTYTDCPIASHTLAFDQPLMEDNFLYLANTLGTSLNASKDHQISVGGVDTNSFEGRHRQVSFNNQLIASVTPAFSDGATMAMFAANGDLNITFPSYGASSTQMTVKSKPPVTASTGSSWLPGGLIIQWGISSVNVSGTKTTITFSPAFSSTAYNVTLTPINNTGSASPTANMVQIDAGSVTSTNFRVTNSSSGSITQIYWLAIGPA